MRVLYFSHANQAFYDLVRAELPDDLELVTLDDGSETERLAKIADAEVVIVGGHRLSRAHIEAASRLRFVQHQGVGYHDTVDLAALAERQAALAICPEGTSLGVAEHTLMLMLGVCKRVSFVDAELRQGRWHANTLRDESRQLTGMTVGIVGLGRIGKMIAEFLQPFRTTTLYHDILDMPGALEKQLKVTRVPFDELLARSDMITLHVPLTDLTHRMINRETLARMKRGAMLINCARGPIVDEPALVEALEAGHLGGAGLDVFEVEPPAHPTPFAKFHNVVLTPHNAAGNREVMITKFRAMVANIRRFQAGEPLENRIQLG